MTDPIPQAVLDAADMSEITQLILTERECRDLGRWQRMASCFHPDSRVKLSWFNGTGPKFVEGSIDMARRGMMAKHRLGPIGVRLAGHRAVASLSAIIDIPEVISEIEVQLSSHARFLFRTEKRDGRWGISFFDCLYLRDELTTAIPGISVPVTFEDLKPFRKSYRVLSYMLSLKVYAPNTELAGDDRPETVAALMAEVFGWAGIDPDAPR
ncbi:MAG: nuclear transport factor 2 family protein [Rhizobiales bacterium]|nr:nuclear transport factor 2 family protein [Hyphomicrobiales bacterium]